MARNKYPEETINLILDVALKLFLEKGYEKTTIQDIVDNLGGLTKGALYYHFKSKDELLIGVSERVFKTQNPSELYDLAKSSDINANQRLGRFFDAVIDDTAENTLRRIYPDLKSTPQMIVQMLLSTIDSPGSRLIEDIISQGVEEGTVKTAYPKQMSEMVMILMNMWVNPYVWPADEKTLNAKIEFISEILSLYGFGKLSDIVSAETMSNIMSMAKKK